MSMLPPPSWGSGVGPEASGCGSIEPPATCPVPEVSFRAALSQLASIHSNEIRRLRYQLRDLRQRTRDASAEDGEAEDVFDADTGVAVVPSSPLREPHQPPPPWVRLSRHAGYQYTSDTASFNDRVSWFGGKRGSALSAGSASLPGWCSDPKKPDFKEEVVARLSRVGRMTARPSKRSSSGNEAEVDLKRQADQILEAATKVATPAARRNKGLKKQFSSQLKSMKTLNRSHTMQLASNNYGILKKFAIRVCKNSCFDPFCSLVILLNSALIGYTTEYAAESVRNRLLERQEPMTATILSHCCSVFFFAELMLRMLAQGREFFCKAEGRGWNIFDSTLVLISFVDICFESSSAGPDIGGKQMKTIKMLRIVRVFRVFRFFRELSLLALMILDSMKSLLWALVLLCIIIYVFAIVFTDFAAAWLRDNRDFDVAVAFDTESVANADRFFGSLWRSVYILIQCMLNGISWGLVSDSLKSMHPVITGAFFFYLAFTILAVLNIITGVFVDNAVETAKTQRDWLVQKEMELREKYVVEMREIFLDMDEDGSGTMTLSELQAGLRDPRILSYFTALGLELHDTARLFSLIDDDGSGDVSIDEFLDGCLRLKGQAKSIDMHAVLHQMRRLEAQILQTVGAPPGARPATAYFSSAVDDAKGLGSASASELDPPSVGATGTQSDRPRVQINEMREDSDNTI